MKILLAASEAVPFCKTGGLADVAAALSQKLGGSGHDVCLFLPKYMDIEASGLQGGASYPLSVPFGPGRIEAQLRYQQWRRVSVCFIDYPALYARKGLYNFEGKDHPDNDKRFALLCRGALEGAKVLGFKPDIVHCHDWQTGLIPAYLKRHYAKDPFFANTSSVMTVHNMAYQGIFPKASLEAAGFGGEEFTPDSFEYYGSISYLKAGLVFADQITTVSPTYAREITESSERGFGMEGLLRRRQADLTGIINGLDLEIWNPSKDAFIPKRYSPKDWAEGKAACKAALQKECGLSADPRKPLVAIVSRLDHQKGLDLAMTALGPRLDRLQLVVVGTGDPNLQDAFRTLQMRHPASVRVQLSFDDALAHRAYAGADVFLMPSRFEPCGLGQLIAMRYGTPPVAARTGGLADTVFESTEGGKPANGFLAAPGDADAVGRALDRALSAYSGAGWKERVEAALGSALGWDRSAERYLEVFRRAGEAAKARR